MIENKITTSYYESNFSILKNRDRDLIIKAVESLKSAYAPYSGFLVGCSLYLENGEIISANNQENVAYPSGLCAERVGIFYAGSKFPNVKINTIAISAISRKFQIEDFVSPCGACRQSIAEYEVKQEEGIRILLHQPDDSVLIFNSISDLLPLMFTSKDLKSF